MGCRVQGAGCRDEACAVSVAWRQDADGEVMELRRIIYQNLPYLNRLYAYYQQDLNDSQNSDEPLKDQVEHDGHDPCDDEVSSTHAHTHTHTHTPTHTHTHRQ